MVASRQRTLALVMLALLVGSPMPRARAADAPARPWGGIFPTVLTPFQGPSGGVDTVALDRQLEYAMRAGVHGLVVCDSYGEGEYLTPEERVTVIRTAVRRSFPRIPVVVGIHTWDVADAQRQMQAARELGAAAVLVKYTGRPNASATDVLQFMRGIGQSEALPIFYDHCPARSGIDLSTTEIAQLLALPGIVGIREAPGALAELEEHVKLCRHLHRAFFSATALDLTQFLQGGGCGAMCPEAVLLPEATVKAYRAYIAGRHAEAAAIQEELYALAPIYRLHPALPILERVAYMTVQDFKPTAPTGQEEPQSQMKAALCALGIPTPTWVKTPLPTLTTGDQYCVTSTMNAVKKIDWCEVSMRVPPAPLSETHGVRNEKREGGMLLKTGAFQLGAGVSKDLLRSVNDGNGGFFP